MRREETVPPPPWESLPDRRPVFAVIWATGADPRLDGVFRLAALRASDDRTWESFDSWVDPFPDREDDAASARVMDEYGVRADDVRDAPGLAEVWPEFRAFCCARGPVVTTDGESFEAWFQSLESGAPDRPTCVGLNEFTALLAPGRLALLGEGLVDALHPTPRPNPPRAIRPEELRAALAELVRRFQDDDPRTIRVAAVGYARAWHGFAAIDPLGARRLAAVLSIVEQPSVWATGTESVFDEAGLSDGTLSTCLEAATESELLLDGLMPRTATAFDSWVEAPKLPPTRGVALPFPREDEERLDDLFRIHLPALFEAEFGIDPATAYRPSQHEVARRVARALGGSELLLVHAPTGTGKTMAYLLSALLWARRHGVRVGVATYTRALQEQAMDREVPRALAALARSGIAGGTRVSVLKGRENYLCFRALRLAAPAADDEPESWLAWSQLALFALTDLDGDLDRFPRRAPIGLMSESRYRAIAGSLVRATRSRSGCCEHRDDRATCAAELARGRAERSHLVITNQSFTLTRAEFLRHVVFSTLR